jgi:mannose-1-phosphate guanylyltransferase/mannose-6-phosphate isomerase
MINEEHKFLSTLRKAIKVAHQGFIVTLGIKPKSPQTGYGYIKINLKFKIQNSKIKTQNSKIYRVERFIEKPSLSRARKFFKDRRFYWNSGIFIFRVDTLLEEIKKIMPDTYKIITKMQNSNLKDCIQLWHKLPATSIDYAIMEKTKKLALIPLDFAWLDLGSWEALAKVLKTDKNGNIFRGNCIDIGSKNSFVWSDKPYVATLGLDNIIVVDIKDSLLVCTKQKTQDIKKIVQIIAAKRARK